MFVVISSLVRKKVLGILLSKVIKIENNSILYGMVICVKADQGVERCASTHSAEQKKGVSVWKLATIYPMARRNSTSQLLSFGGIRVTMLSSLQ